MVLEEFLDEWNDERPVVKVHTSGSTGIPKELSVEKSRMRASAEITCDFLGLNRGDTALLCLPVDYIAGKMMVVRSLVRGLDLFSVQSSSHPLENVADERKIDFCAMVPMQVYNSMQVPEECSRLRRIKHLIIGGGAVDDEMIIKLKDFPNNVWSTYGMTETLSHIALRRLSGNEASQWYTPFSSVDVWTNDDDCLVIDAPRVCDGVLVTNDIVETRNIISEGKCVTQFRIKGRKDNVICSGGIKIQIEEAESMLKRSLSKAFLVTKRKDKVLGEAVVLLSEDDDLDLVRSACKKVLPKYWQPRFYVHVDEIPLTQTGKPARAAAERIAAEQ